MLLLRLSESRGGVPSIEACSKSISAEAAIGAGSKGISAEATAIGR